MNRHLQLIVLIASAIVLQPRIASSQSGTPSRDTIRISMLKSKAYFCIDALIREDFAAASLYFDSTQKVDFAADTLKRFWGLFRNQAGDIIKSTDVKDDLYEDSLTAITTTISCQRGKWDFKFVYSQSNVIERMFAEKTPPPVPKSYQFPDYVDRENVREFNITVGKGEWALPGAITMPTQPGKYPAIILIHGSGPMDRDETIYSNKPFRDLAWGLASQGLAVLRYDKRTKHYYKKIGKEHPILTTQFEVIDDALEAVKVLKANKDIIHDRIFILGHSLGGMLAPRIAKQDSTIAGMVILSGNARPLEDLILEQTEYIFGLDGIQNEERKNIIKQLKRQIKNIKSPTFSIATPPDSLPLQVPAPYWLDIQNYNPPALASILKKPTLVLQGERDYQVTMDDFKLWKKFLPPSDNTQYISYPALNHLYLVGSGKSRPDEYRTPSHVAKETIDDIAKWVIKRSKK